MNLTSEQVHWVFGAVLSLLPIPLLLDELAVIDGRWPSFIVPIALFAPSRHSTSHHRGHLDRCGSGEGGG